MAQRREDATIALFLDIENLAIHAMQQGVSLEADRIVDRVRQEGRIVFARAYGDFRQPFLKGVLRDLQRIGIELGQLSTDAKGKNTADMQLSLDALEMALQSTSPEAMVIASGDRDYVPLVQKVKRYHKVLIGMGLKGSISGPLEHVCDTYWYYDDLLPRGEPTAEEAAPASEAIAPAPTAAPAVTDEVSAAIETVVRAVGTLEAQGTTCTGAQTALVVRRLDPTFEVRRLGFSTFKDLAHEAERRGAIVIAGSQGMDFVMESIVPTGPTTVVRRQSPESTPPEEMAAQYRLVLSRKKVPMVTWKAREMLVRRLWSELATHDAGMTIVDMNKTMADYALISGNPIPEAALHKISYTLNLGRCFRRGESAAFIDDIFNEQVHTAVTADQALERMHVTYLRGIKIDAPSLPLQARGVALFLYGSLNDEYVARAEACIRLVDTWSD